MYWVQECGNSNNSNYRSFMCDYISDIQNLPTQTKEGRQGADIVSMKPCAAGSDCLCLEDSSIWVLGKDTDNWKQL